MKKACFFIALLISAFFVVVGEDVKAANFVWFEQNFDTYATGTTLETIIPDFIWNTGTTSVSNLQATSSPNSLTVLSTARNKLTFEASSTNGYVFFDFYMVDNTTTYYLRINLQDSYSSASSFPQLTFTDTSGNCALGNPSASTYYEVSCNAWHHFEMTISDSNCQIEIDGINIDDNIPNGACVGSPWWSFWEFEYLSPAENTIFIDNLELLSIYDEDITGDTFGFFYDITGFATQYPVGCQYNQIASDTVNIIFPMAFQFTNDASSSVNYTELDINFYDSENNATTIIAYSSIITPGDTVGYSDTITLPAKSYRIEYEAIGYNINTGESISFLSGGTGIDGNQCICTSIGYQETISNESCNWGTLGYLACQEYYSNCIASTTGSWVDNATCHIEDFFVSFICPSAESLAKTKGILADIKTRFPFNYILAANSNFNTFANSLSATSSATTVYWNLNIEDYSGFGNMPFVDYLRNIISFIIIGWALYYIINYATKHALK